MGFTLLELLVVISVIMMLMSVLLPALRAAKGKATQINCMNNMSQIGKGYQLYIMDYNDYICWFHEWPRLLGPYLTNTQQWVIKSYTGPYKRGSWMDLYFCPSNCDGLSSATGSYLVNDSVTGGYYDSWKKMNQIKKPSNILLQSEAAINSSGYFYWEIWQDSDLVPGSDCKIAWKHMNGTNVLFADSHTAFYKIGKITPQMRQNY